jgi:hypothetical protein
MMETNNRRSNSLVNKFQDLIQVAIDNLSG